VTTVNARCRGSSSVAGLHQRQRLVDGTHPRNRGKAQARAGPNALLVLAGGRGLSYSIEIRRCWISGDAAIAFDVASGSLGTTWEGRAQVDASCRVTG
jgi:hypothetical protein